MTQLKTVFVYRIYCGCHGKLSTDAFWNRGVLRGILAGSDLDGYTINEGVGLWGGKEEPTDVVTYISGRKDKDYQLILDIAKEYKKATGQEEVWVTRSEEVLSII